MILMNRPLEEKEDLPLLHQDPIQGTVVSIQTHYLDNGLTYV